MAHSNAGSVLEGARIQEEAEVVTDSGAGLILDEHRRKMKRAIVFIQTPLGNNRASKGSGFITKLEVKGQKRWLLMTCNHVLPSLPDALKSDIYFGRVSDREKGTLIKGEELFDARYFETDSADFPAPWSQKRFDYTVVEVRERVMRETLKDEMPQPFSLMMEKEGLHVNDMLYVVHYPKEKGFARCENAEHIRVLNGPYIGHIATTYGGSSGSPMLREYNNEWIVVGLHRGGMPKKINLATCINVIVDHAQGKPYQGEIPDPASFDIEADVDPPPADLPSADPEVVLKEFRDDFIKVMEAATVASSLRAKGIIPQGCQEQILGGSAGGRKMRNEILHDRLVTNCTRETLIDACNIFIAEEDFPRMNALGAAMKEKLAPAAADPEAVLKEFRDTFIKKVEADVVASALRAKGIIPQGCQEQILASCNSRKLRNEILHERMVTNCTRKALIDACNIFIALEDSPKINALGIAMKKRLESGK